MTIPGKGIGAILGVALLVSTAAGCGGQGEGGGGGAASALPSVTRSVTRSPVQPSATRSEGGPTVNPPSPTVAPTSDSGRPPPTTQAPKPPEAEPTRTRSAEPEPAQPGATASASALTSVSVSTSTSAATQPEAAATDEEAAVAAWVWWLLALLVAVTLLAGAVLIRRRRGRDDWSAGLANALEEATWLSNDLIPALQGQSAAGRSGVWAVSRPRVLQLEQTLEGLVGQAPDDVTSRRCTTLTSVVQALRQTLDQPAATGVDGGEAATTALHQAQLQLAETIAALRVRSGRTQAT